MQLTHRWVGWLWHTHTHCILCSNHCPPTPTNIVFCGFKTKRCGTQLGQEFFNVEKTSMKDQMTPGGIVKATADKPLDQSANGADIDAARPPVVELREPHGRRVTGASTVAYISVTGKVPHTDYYRSRCQPLTPAATVACQNVEKEWLLSLCRHSESFIHQPWSPSGPSPGPSTAGIDLKLCLLVCLCVYRITWEIVTFWLLLIWPKRGSYTLALRE